jgi:acetoin utilization protein AcuB
MGTRVEEVMTPDPVTLGPEATVREAYVIMSTRRFRHVPIVDGEALIGVISLTDIGKLGARVPQILAMTLKDVMTTDVVTVDVQASVDVAAALMASRKIHSLCVMEDGKLVGILTTYDLLDALARRLRGQE